MKTEKKKLQYKQNKTNRKKTENQNGKQNIIHKIEQTTRKQQQRNNNTAERNTNFNAK